MTTDGGSAINQKQGVINKCPSCGGALKAFSTICGLCGHELAGVAANRTVTDLAERFNEIEAEVDRAGLTGGKRESEIIARKARVIRDFPIPNSREDLQSLIFFIHPKIQNNLKPDPNAEDWRVKFKEVMTLAKNAYKGDAKTRAEFEEMERSLTITLSGNLKTSAKRNPVVAIGVGLVAVIAAVGLASTQLDKWKSGQCQDKYAQGAVAEKARLDGIVAVVQAKLKEKNYTDAFASLNQLRWEYQEPCKLDEAKQEQSQWEEQRKELTAMVQKAEAADSAQKKEQSDREVAAVKEQASQEADLKAKQMGTERKAATNKEW